MSGPRASARVQNKESQLREQQEREEALALSNVAAANKSFFACLEQHTGDVVDFELPADWTAPPPLKRQKMEADDEDGEEVVVPKKVAKLSIPPYRVLRQNLYRPPLQRVLADPEECTACDCKPEVGCGPRCHNRLLYMECLPGQCPSMCLPKTCMETSSSRSRTKAPTQIKPESVEDADAEADADAVLDDDATSCCLNTAIQTRAFPQVEVFLTSPEPEASSATTDTSSASATTARGRSLQSAKSAKSADEPAVSKGYGLKICEAISRGTIIVEYLGEVITAAECLRRMKSYSQHDAFYFAGLDNGLMLDAKAMGSVARFANHSCAPTCLLQKWTVQGECRLVLVAGRDMQAGEEVTYNYHYFDDSLEGVRGMQRQRCMCGASNCCGTIGGRVTTKLGDEQGGDGGRRGLQELLDQCVSMQIPLPDASVIKVESQADSASGAGSCSASGSVEVGTDDSAAATVDKKPTASRRHPPEVLRDLLEEIQQAIAGSDALVGVPSTRFYTNNTAEIVPKLTAFAHAIEAALASTQAWLSDRHTLLGGLAPSGTSSTNHALVPAVPLPRAQELLARAPPAVRIPEVAQLEGWVRNAVRAERILADIINRCDPAQTLLSTVESSNKSAVPTASKVDWQEFVLAVKAVLTALPIECTRKHVQKLLLMYERSALWARQVVSPIVTGASGGRARRAGVSASAGAAAKAGAAGAASSAGHSDEEFKLFEQLLDAYVLQPGKAVAADVMPTDPAASLAAQDAPQSNAAVKEDAVTSSSAPAQPVSTSKAAKVPKLAAQPKPRADALALVLPLLSDPHSAAAFLDDRLTTYMERLELEEALTKRAAKNPLQANQGLFRPAQEGILTPAASTQALLRAHSDANDTASSSPPSAEESSSGMLYCFCRLPEDCGESSVLTQCASCQNWYHPQCLNAPQASLGAAMRQRDFACPVCQHLRNAPSNFIFEPQSEWAHIKPTAVQPPSKKIPTAESKKPKLKSKETGSNANVIKQEYHSVPIDAAENVDNEFDEAGGKRKRPAAPTPGAPIPRNNPYGNISGLRAKTAPVVKAKDYLTAAELDQALAAEMALEISASPASLLLRLAARYLAAWRIQCTTFLCSSAVGDSLRQLASYIPSVATTGPVSVSIAHREEVVLQACVLQRCLELYFETRIVRIRDEPLCTSLRQVAWMLSCATMLREVVLSDPEVNSSADHVKGDTMSSSDDLQFPRHRPTASELGRIVRFGAQLFPAAASAGTVAIVDDSTHAVGSRIFSVGAGIASHLHHHHDTVSAALSASQECRTREDAPAVLRLWDAVVQAGFVRVEEEFAYAKIRCLCRKINATTAVTATSVLESALEESKLPHVVSAQSSEEMCVEDGSQDAMAPAATESSAGSLIVAEVAELATEALQDVTKDSDDPLATASLAQDSSADDAIPAAAEVYCYCRQGDDGSPMVSCDSCEEWFHCGCVGYDSTRVAGQGGGSGKQQRKKKSAPVNAESSYLCISCCVVSGRPYSYAW